MSSVHSTSKDGLADAWVGVRNAASMPARTQAPHTPRTVESAEAHTAAMPRWTRTLLRRVRDVMVGLAVISAIPFSIVAVRNVKLWHDGDSYRSRLAEVELWRPLVVAKDPSITPMQAGEALRVLLRVRSSNDFPQRAGISVLERGWQSLPMTADMFPQIRAIGLPGPAPQAVVAVARSGFNANEMTYLRAVAESPVWEEFDKVGRAQRIDLIGGRFALPFRDDAFAPRLPMWSFADAKTLASAGVSRAAYHLANGQPDKAEAALRSVVSFGIALMDNGMSAYDALFGRVIAGIGRDGLHQFYDATGDANRADATAHVASTTATTALSTRQRLSLDELQRHLLRDVNDPALPRAVRFERLQRLSYASNCSVGGMLRGPSREVLTAFEEAKRTLARFPSERAYLDLLQETPNRLPDDFADARTVPGMVVAGSATIASIVLHAPRVAMCTRFALDQ
jgi:hypothetical protein